MFRLPLIISLLIYAGVTLAQDTNGSTSPHGKDLSFDCKLCHSTSGWTVDVNTIAFNHDSTSFLLEGSHELVDCKSCHATLEFSKAQNDCVSCHTDMHQETVGQDCSRCHNSNSWLIENLSDIHERVSFPLDGVHFDTDCISCHESASNLEFQPMDVNCVNCHRDTYGSTTDPNHTDAGYSTDCTECHSIFSFDWIADNFYHDFFPLTEGHDFNDCSRCHQNRQYEGTPTDCYACHQANFESTNNPDHIVSGFSTDCITCHTTAPDWNPAKFEEHDHIYFPVYTGKHSGEWNQCKDCHTDPGNFASFSCTVCHEHRQSSVDGDHKEVAGYVYSDQACLACHPNGETEGAFDHGKTSFPLEGAHVIVECSSCHDAGYAGTSSECVSCHQQDYNDAKEPDHIQLGLTTDCATCHTADPEWNPAVFPQHSAYYTFNGAHIAIATDCKKCHNGDYANTPNTCVGCHQADYNATTDPPHLSSQFSTACETCHGETSWKPSTFDHDGLYFPIFSGKHNGEWNLCQDCHTNSGNYAEFSCIDCHEHNKADTDDEHSDVGGYTYDSQSCLSCHPTGDSDDGFNHNSTGFPLTGAHQSTDCTSCHINGYAGTSSNCVDCHQVDYDQSLNPNHIQLGQSTDCIQCHTTEPDWNPASFGNHDDYHPLNGAHALIRNNCTTCHNGEYNNTPNTCYACHQANYASTSNPSHESLQFSTDCIGCHTEDVWTPATFDHDNQYFPIYSGKHQDAWTNCNECHTDASSYTVFSCINCHSHNQADMDDEHKDVSGYNYDSQSCYACHQNGDGEGGFNHDLTEFALTGAHKSVDCETCHVTGYAGTSTQCVACHETSFSETVDPNHQNLEFPTECEQCHSTEPDWSPASMPLHDDFFPLTGGHSGIANECTACHADSYSNTSSSCSSCHIEDYNASSNPDHLTLALPTDCNNCHTTAADWTPASFTIHDDYYVLEGAHASIASDCAVCHNGDYNNTPNTCFACHAEEYNQTTDPNHNIAQFSTDCTSCHTQSTWTPSTFDHDNQYFPIYTGTHQEEWNSCVECHTESTNYAQFNCLGCHTNPETNDNHAGIGGYIYDSETCLICHPYGQSDDAFDHNNTSFALTGAHLSLDCNLCHESGYAGTPTDCNACHTDNYNQTSNPNHTNLGLSTVCETCHTTDPGWSPAEFPVHDDYYALTGAHLTVASDCTGCHDGDYNNTPNTCAGCHTDNYNQTTNPNHTSLGLSTACETCHTTEPGWNPAEFPDHDNYYALTGAHLTISSACVECHNGDYNNTPNTCNGCHNDDYNQTSNPNHTNLSLSTDCASCHTTEPDWNPAEFPDHDSYYTLTGAHIAVSSDCAGCHNGDYNNTPNTCSGCHTDDYNQSTNPNHANLGLSTDCETCHTTEPDWNPAEFPDHDNYYTLTGAHIAVSSDCAACHNGDYNNTPNTCSGCHTDDYNQSTNPNHANLGLSTDCETCHTTEPDWNPADFPVHDNYYALTGAHIAVAADCAGCHNGDYNNTPTNCSGCHLNDYNQTSNPNHSNLGISTDCESCHTTEPDWNPAEFPIHDNYYPLTGAHIPISSDCAICHNGDYNNTPNTCSGCHIEDYNQTTNPNHTSLGISTDCASCHTTEPDWSPADFPIHESYYPLTGAHALIASDCAACHNGDYSNTPNTCAGCHTSDYNQTTNPSHTNLGLSTDCETCHTTDPDWNPASFPDHDSYYALNGAHAAISSDCVLCHNGDYNNTPTTCFGCHESDYNSTTDPDHATAQFPTDCESCHSETAWEPSTFDHDGMYFPIYSGKHQGEWTTCSECHQNSSNYADFTCLTCHTNPDTDDDHSEVTGYSYDSPSCLACHPDGEE